jgi:hypothetical protein
MLCLQKILSIVNRSQAIKSLNLIRPSSVLVLRAFLLHELKSYAAAASTSRHPTDLLARRADDLHARQLLLGSPRRAFPCIGRSQLSHQSTLFLWPGACLFGSQARPPRTAVGSRAAGLADTFRRPFRASASHAGTLGGIARTRRGACKWVRRRTGTEGEAVADVNASVVRVIDAITRNARRIARIAADEAPIGAVRAKAIARTRFGGREAETAADAEGRPFLVRTAFRTSFDPGRIRARFGVRSHFAHRSVRPGLGAFQDGPRGRASGPADEVSGPG